MNSKKLNLAFFLMILLSSSCDGVAPSEEEVGKGQAAASSVEGPAPAGTHQDPYVGRGKVKTLQPERKRIVIQHEDIPHFMEAMVMAFPISDVKIIESIQVGDEIEFKIARLNGSFEIFEIRKLEPGTSGVR